MSEKLNELREQAQELIVSGNATEKAQGHGMLTVLDAIKKEGESFKMRVTFIEHPDSIQTLIDLNKASYIEMLGLIAHAKQMIISNHGGND